MNDIALSISLGELCECEQVSRQWLVTMVEHEIVIPVSVAGEVEDWMFDTRSVPWMKRAIRLHRDVMGGCSLIAHYVILESTSWNGHLGHQVALEAA